MDGHEKRPKAAEMERMRRNIVIASNFTIEHVLPTLKEYLDKVHDCTIEVAPYNQIFQQLLDPSSLFNSNSNGLNVVFLRIEDLIDQKAIDFRVGEDDLARIKRNSDALIECFETFGRSAIPLLLFICPQSARIAADERLSNAFESIEQSIKGACTPVENIFVCRTDNLTKRYGVESVDNPTGNMLGHVPYTEDYFSAMGIELARSIDAHFRKPFKVLVLDCDNTLWDGVCGEDGTDGIRFSEARIRLQELAVEQSRSGMVICLCSKNNEPEVWEVFERRPEMKLKREHLVSARINWKPKSINLRSLSDELQLGLDSFVFIDDDRVVCAEVRANCPEVLTIQLPEVISEIPAFLDHLWVFDHLKLTAEDAERTRSYRSQVERNKIKAQAPDLSSFLANLQLECEIGEIAPDQIARVSQLSLRTNQFNSTTVRYSEADIRQLISEDGSGIVTVRVNDRFGDYGLVGAVIYEKMATSLTLKSFMLSCRVLGRGVEYAVLREIGRLARNTGKEFVIIEYSASKKNAPFFDFVNDLATRYQIEPDPSGEIRITAEMAAIAQIEDRRFQPDTNEKSEKNTSATDPGDVPLYRGNAVYVEISSSLSRRGSSQEPTSPAPLDRSCVGSKFVEPRRPTELWLHSLWERLLRISGIGIADNFFEVGGDSLVAVTLFVEIEEEFGISLPLSILIDSPTIEKLADVIETGRPDKKWKYLVPLKSEGSRPPIFCMHAAGGNVLFYRDLAGELPADQPVFGLQARGIADKSETAHDRVEEMARDYLKEIRSLQPHGPYRLCGSSFGGLVAFEAAIQLQQAGETVEVLALFDTYAPGYLTPEKTATRINGLSRLFGRTRSLSKQLSEIASNGDRLSFIWSKAKKLQNRLKRKIAWKRNEFAIEYSKATGRDLPVDMMRNHKAIQAALDHYEPAKYQGDVWVFRASEQPKNSRNDQTLGWSRFVSGELTSETVKGTHGALTVYPFAADLAARFELITASVEADKRTITIAAAG